MGEEDKMATYASVTTTTTRPADSTMPMVKPVYMKYSEATTRGERWLSTREICGAAEKIAGYETMEGAQLVGGLWRLYAKSRAARTALLAEGLTLRGRKIPLYDHNPFIVDGQGENTTPTTRVTIKGIPLSADDRDIVKSLERFGCKLRSAVMYEKDRDEDKKLTRWKNGNRFVFIEIPAEPLPAKMTFCNFRGVVKHREQHYRKPEDMTCGKCLLKGHYSKICPNDIVCRDCGMSGHPDCQFLTAQHREAEIPSPSAEDVIERSFRLYVEKEPAATTSPGTSGNNEGCHNNSTTEVNQTTSGAPAEQHGSPKSTPPTSVNKKGRRRSRPTTRQHKEGPSASEQDDALTRMMKEARRRAVPASTPRKRGLSPTNDSSPPTSQKKARGTAVDNNT
ncbi:uncharacterized protein [Branchiostoma lanceolatum]|uniref:uncharacterized protein n=1 Tax=Branchiostoma lanceolatum TaxID=7740 RepID=UPI003455475C